MVNDIPKKLEELPQITTEWADLLWSKDRGEVTPDMIRKNLLVDSTRILTDASVLQASIAFRALNLRDTWLNMMKKHPDERPRTCPRVQIKPTGFVDMSWGEIQWMKKPVTQGSTAIHSRCPNFILNTDAGPVQIFKWSNRIPIGLHQKYNICHFRDNPLWAVELAEEIENGFYLLRKEQTLISSIKRNIASINSLQDKAFPEESESLYETENLISLYQPDLTKPK